jgi:hypothetical protein
MLNILLVEECHIAHSRSIHTPLAANDNGLVLCIQTSGKIETLVVCLPFLNHSSNFPVVNQCEQAGVPVLVG